MEIHIAPVQGHTDAAWRKFHSETYPVADTTYYTPFIRLEKGDIRKKDINDLLSPLNEGVHVVPQIIFRDAEELTTLVERIRSLGFKEIDLNMGCPFPLQTARGRGAATVANTELHKAVKEVALANPDITFSVKMRLGFAAPDEWTALLPVLNEIPLRHIAVHPRIARQQYGGELDMEQFEAILAASRNPIVFNGELRTPEDIRTIAERYPQIKGVMLGRGLLGSPSLALEYARGEEWDDKRRSKEMKTFHRTLFSHYTSTLVGGDHQVLSKIQPFWEYAEPTIGRKAWKAIKKAGNMAKYHTALALI